MLNSLSILLPSYNNNCVSLVKQLHRQAELLGPQGLRYEIIVADDGSTNFTTIASNQQIEQLSHCRFIRRNHNSGRAAIRNFLAQQASQEYLLFIDSDRMPGSKLFLYNYLSLKEVSVACGGLHIVGDKKELKGNIRFLLERKYELHNTARERSEKPYHNFNTSGLSSHFISAFIFSLSFHTPHTISFIPLYSTSTLLHLFSKSPIRCFHIHF